MGPRAVTSTFAIVLVVIGWPRFSRAQDARQNVASIDDVAGTRARLTGTVPPWLGRATKGGSADENNRVVIAAYLRWRKQTDLEQLVEDQTTPGSPSYGGFLSPEQFHAAYSPAAEDVTRVQEALRGLGLKVEQTPASGLFVVASGTVAQIKRGFQVSQDVYSYRGKRLRANAEDPVLPGVLAGVVTYIGGLDDSRLLKRPARPQDPGFGMPTTPPPALMPP